MGQTTGSGRTRPRTLLDAIPADKRAALLEGARLRRFRTGDIVLHEGDPARSLHVIDQGRFSLHASLPTGESVMLRVLGPGDVFGEMGLLSEDGTRAATVRALEPGVTRTIERLRFLDVLASEPGASLALLGLLAEKIRRSDARQLEALYVPADTRVLRRLCEVAALYPARADGAIAIPLRQEDLAELAGTSRGTVNRVLRAEAARGTVRLQRGSTLVLDLAAIERVAAGPA